MGHLRRLLGSVTGSLFQSPRTVETGLDSELGDYQGAGISVIISLISQR